MLLATVPLVVTLARGSPAWSRLLAAARKPGCRVAAAEPGARLRGGRVRARAGLRRAAAVPSGVRPVGGLRRGGCRLADQRRLRYRSRMVLAAYVVYVALALPGILWTGAANSLEYYGEGIGGIPGARTLGFETTYLADTYKPAVEYVNAAAPEGATVYVQAGTYPVMETYRRIGDLREDLRPAYLAPIAPGRYTRDETAPRELVLPLPAAPVHLHGPDAGPGGEGAALRLRERAAYRSSRCIREPPSGRRWTWRARPEARDVGLLNAAVAFGGVLTLLVYLWAKRGGRKNPLAS